MHIDKDEKCKKDVTEQSIQYADEDEFYKLFNKQPENLFRMINVLRLWRSNGSSSMYLGPAQLYSKCPEAGQK